MSEVNHEPKSEPERRAAAPMCGRSVQRDLSLRRAMRRGTGYLYIKPKSCTACKVRAVDKIAIELSRCYAQPYISDVGRRQLNISAQDPSHQRRIQSG